MNKDNVKIGKFNDKHIAQMVELCKELVPGECSISNFEANYNKIKDKDNYYIVEASIDDKLVGTAMGCIITALDGNFMVVENVIVSQDLRGLGVGKKIMQELDNYAHDNNCEYSILVLSGFRKNAHKFYESIGYNDDVRGFRKNY